ncbi:MAG: transposase [bacterium]|nr:transposase [bacterium]
MPRNARIDIANEYYHVINRANGRLEIFKTPADYALFEELLLEAVELFEMSVVAYVLMPNHWHFLLSPRADGDLGRFMHRLSNSHTRKVHALTNTNGGGHLYQGRYKSFLVDTDKYLLSLVRYIERNPVRAGLVGACEEWQWGSAFRRFSGNMQQKRLLTDAPTDLPHEYRAWINTAETPEELSVIRTCVTRGMPYGRDSWVDVMINRFKLQSTQRSVGRPRKN